MILDNRLDIPADPDAVFALINDVERVASCLPGAVLDGREDDTYLGRVRFKVGPISAAYAGKIRFTEVASDQRRLRLSARGADSHGNGDAEADVTLTVAPAPGGSTLDLHTDLVVRGKIAQFGKGAITSVSTRLLDQFARNLAAQLREPAGEGLGPTATASRPATDGPSPAATASLPATDGSAPAATASRPTAEGPTPTAAASWPAGGGSAPAAAGEPLDGLAMLLPANAGRYAAAAGALVVAFFQGWLLGRIRTQDALIRELRRGR